MTDTINNVPRELMADLLGNDHDKRIMAERHLLAMLANTPSPANHVEDVRAMVDAPSPAGVDGLKVVGYIQRGGIDGAEWEVGGAPESVPVTPIADAQAIIDGLRGENEALHAQVKVLQSDANSWQSGYDEGRRMGGKHCALTIDQQAQRIGELEGLLRKWRRIFDSGPGSGQLGVLRGQTDAALSASKEGE